MRFRVTLGLGRSLQREHFQHFANACYSHPTTRRLLRSRRSVVRIHWGALVLLLAVSVAARPGRARACGAPRDRGPSTPDAAPKRAARGGGSNSRLGEERSADTSDGTFDIAHDERRFEPENAISGADERRISARVGAGTLGVVDAIDLEHETLRGCVEVCDEATEQRHLPAKEHAEPPAANARPKQLLGRRERYAHASSALRKRRCTLVV